MTVTEQELIDRAIAPRVSKLEIDTIVREGKLLYDHAHHPLTLAIFQHPNGFWLIGHSAPASPENFDEAIGERLALEKVISQLWLLEGFMLRSKLHEKELADEAGHAFDHVTAAAIGSSEPPDPLGTPPKPRPDDEVEPGSVPPGYNPDDPSVDPEDDDEDEENPAPDDGESTTSAEEENPNREPPPRAAAGEEAPGEDAVSDAQQRRDYAKDGPRGMTGFGS